MHGNAIDFGFPSLSEDPFSSSPLEKDELDLLVGRHALFDELERKIAFKSANRILLVGEFGSGKTSFMQCLSSRTNLHLKIGRIAFSEPGVELLKDMYAQLIDGSPPHDYSKLDRELRRMLHDSRQMLPLITIDADMADFSSLEACLRSSLHFFESLPALIIIAINPQQQSLISEQLLQRFELRTMPELGHDGIKAMVERRIAKVATQPYQMSSEDANRLLLLSQSGHPGALIRVLRNAVSGTHDAPSGQLPQPAYVPPVVKSPAEVVTEPEFVENVPSTMDVNEPLDDEFVDEEWEQTPGMTESSGFDLDFQILDEPLELPEEEPEDDPIELPEIQNESSEDSYVTERSLPFVGAFGGLRNRNIVAIEDKRSVPEGQFRETDQGTAFWSAEEFQSVFEEDEGEEVEVIETEELHTLNDEPLDSGYLEEVDIPEPRQFDMNAIETFTRLLSQVLQPSGTGLHGDQQLIEQLRALSRPRLTEKEEHVLSIAVLSSLTASESIVVAEAKGRTISPSDRALLERLSIKRARLSQICNRLHKAGILHARMVGRSRMFGLTRSALAQLIAWGIVGGDE
ncbi:MAG: Uncharacterised protein [Candidatus Poseidoniaceae archaeon]|nr:MAG: Uncharacterised protein [Candidatus Poseidoniaceae archaeon]